MTAITAQAETAFRAWLAARGIDTLIHDACVAEAIDELDATDPAILYGHVYELPASCTRSGQPETYTFAPGEIEGDADPAVEYLDAVPLAEGRRAYEDDATHRWYVVAAGDTLDLSLRLEALGPSGDIYSEWCAETIAQEMPRGWHPGMSQEVTP